MLDSAATENIKKANIENTMSSAYLEYAMSVIIGRALPDVRDGLKPVHRRVLFAMHSQNALHNRPYVKSARVVGEVTGKYHPHGETAVYDATVRLAQDFSSRYRLIDGQGNFGSVDGDPPAAMRYTEVRLRKISKELLADLDKDTVDYAPNYDDTLQEPRVLPTRVPTLLLNGSSGIAVGMATNIPPHNLSEIIDGLLYVVKNGKDAAEDALLELVKGPDFPTGANILGRKGIRDVYKTGRGSIVVRSETSIEQLKSGNREAIIVTELPYAVNKARLIEKIASLAKEKKITGIHDLRDESDRAGMRIVIELKRGEQPEPILAFLYKHTALQTSFGAIMLAVVNGKPSLLNLKQMLQLFLDHRIEVVERRTRFELKKSEDRAHILEGLKLCLDNLDEVVELIRSSLSGSEAKERLIERFSLSQQQADSILDMRLQRLTGLEREKIEKELQELQLLIQKLRAILNDRQMVLDIISDELQEIKDGYADTRLTRILDHDGEINLEDTMPEESMVVTLSREGYIKRCPTAEYQTQQRGGKGKIGMTTQHQDIAHQMLTASTHDTLLMFSNMGKVYGKKVYELPLAGRTARGRAIINVLPLAPDEIIMSCLPISGFHQNTYIVMATKNGTVKKSDLQSYQNIRTSGTRAIVIDEGDNLVSARLCKDSDLIFIATYNGLSLKFPTDQLRSQGRVTRGSRGIRLKEFDGKIDSVVSMEIVNNSGFLLTVSERGYGKKSTTESYRLGSRSNSGVLNMKMSERNGKVVGTLFIEDGDQVLMITSSSKIIRIDTSQISTLGRVTQGVKLVTLEDQDSVAFISKVFDIEKRNEAVSEQKTLL